MNRASFAAIASAGLAVLVLIMLRQESGQPPQTPTPAEETVKPALVLYCAASNRAVMEAITNDYRTETGREVQIQYGSSQALLSSLEISRSGDLFLPADSTYNDMAEEKNLSAERLPIGRMTLVVAVRKGNPKKISSLSDLVKSDVRFVQADPDSAASGRLTRDALTSTSQWTSLKEATRAFRGTVTDVCNDITVGAADAGIVFDAVLHSHKDLEAIPIPELSSVHANLEISVTRFADTPATALHFARYVAAQDRGLMRYHEYGFQPIQGDTWADQPEITMFSGAMLRPAVEQAIVRFEQREGVRVSRVYNGCGILVAQMQAGQRPDAYFACDREFMNQVSDLFPTPVDVSENELVILVQKGNPHQIAELRDLARPGLKVGIGHEKQCAMGWLTQNTLREGGVQDEVMSNVTVQSPTGDLLVNQMQTGALDAAVVYLSNATGAADKLDAVRIQDLPCAVAVQPFAVASASKFPQLTARLFKTICSAESREVFELEGFRWKNEAKPAP